MGPNRDIAVLIVFGTWSLILGFVFVCDGIEKVRGWLRRRKSKKSSPASVSRVS